MNKFRFTFKVLAIAIFVFAFASLAQAQATRTWVSGVGDDVNPCSRTAPCKTYAGAISKTAAGGEISTLDPGGFGAVTITKSMMIEGTKGQGYGSILASGTTGVNVNDSASGTPNTIVVTLRNLSINGSGTTLGTNGINFTSGKSLIVEDCVITKFSGTGIRVSFAAAQAVTPQLTVRNTFIHNITADGILATTAAAGQVVNVSLDQVSFSKNGNGLKLQAGGRAVVTRSVFNFHTGTAVTLEGGSEAFIDGNSMASNVNGVAVSG